MKYFKRYLILIICFFLAFIPLMAVLYQFDIINNPFRRMLFFIIAGGLFIIYIAVMSIIIYRQEKKKQMARLTLKNVSFSYVEDEPALIDVSFDVKQGEYVTIIGKNGSGKSTIAKLITGLLPDLDNGEILLDGEKIKEEQIREKIGIVFQNPDNQFIGSTVRDDIAFGLENHQVKHDDMDKIIDEYSELVSMKPFLDKEPSALSGGQKQRVAIAGVLAMHPEIIILDEATAMLDPKGKKEIISLIHQLKKNDEKLSIISITHDVEEAFFSDHVVVLNEGKVIYDDTPENVFFRLPASAVCRGGI